MAESDAIDLLGGGTLETRHAGLGWRILDAWVDMRRSTRRLIEEKPSEHRLLFYVLMSDIIFFLSWSTKTVVAPVSGVKEQVPLEIAFFLIGALMVRTLTMYAFSALLTAAVRPFGGEGSWRDNRAGIFWGALVAAPFGFIMACMTAAMSWLEPYYPILQEEWVALPPYWISLVPFLWFISQGVAEANGFEKNALMFVAMSLMALILMLVAMSFNAGGIF